VALNGLCRCGCGVHWEYPFPGEVQGPVPATPLPDSARHRAVSDPAISHFMERRTPPGPV
ncbi:hypothetical protein, partial [Endozoicomonas sp. ALC013]|uniref:hypothetical protein n=1 Tax=Endozoicomonas sp. ALC013 TaxID=3403076 RepID=UPI003BB56098